MSQNTIKQLFSFIETSPSSFHAVANMKQELKLQGYERLLEGEEWNLCEDGKYYVDRNGSSLIAFRIPKRRFHGFQIMASHSDSPGFKLKDDPEIAVEDKYVKLNVEKYGGPLMAPWFDRPLSVAGRLIIRESGKICSRLVDMGRDFVMIPSLAIHMNREANDGCKYNVQKDMLPLYCEGEQQGRFMRQVAEAAGVEAGAVAGSDLFLYGRTRGTVWGADQEFISIGRLDDLQCAFASMRAFLTAKDCGSIPVHCVFDNGEVGSRTKQGADSTFLMDTLSRINEGLGCTAAHYHQALASSFMLSADNAHAVHPNYPDRACPTNRPYPNGGVVIKFSGSQKYTTDAVAAAIAVQLCEAAGVPYQKYFNHSDIPGGSTLGNISNAKVALNTADIGLAQLAMHSPYETGGARDTDYLIRMAEVFYSTAVMECGDGEYRLERQLY